jgi:GNAT superfamily N-acetyltransferase
MPMLDLPDGYYELPQGKLANVATFLEMRAAPSRALAPWPDDLTLQRFSGDDRDGFLEVFRAVGSDLMWFSRALMPADKLKSILSNPTVHSYALKRGPETLGMLELDFSAAGQCELAFFGLVPNAVGQGLGRALMDEAIRKAWAQPINRMWVHTCTFDHPAALPFYIRSGFTPYARKIEIHPDARLTGELDRSAAPQIPIIE